MKDIEQIKQLLDKWVYGSYEIINGVVNVKGDVYIRGWEEDSLPVQFGTVTGYFNGSENKLVSLEGAPEKVGGNFYCYNNQLVSLAGSPKKVGGHFWCHNNQLVSLKGGPKIVGGSFGCSDNPLEFLRRR